MLLDNKRNVIDTKQGTNSTRIEIFLLILLTVFLIFIILFTFVPVFDLSLTFPNNLSNEYQIIIFAVLYLLLLLQSYIIFYLIIYKNINFKIVKSLIREYDVIMISILVSIVHIWNIPVAIYLYELIFLFFGFDMVYPKLLMSKWFRLSFLIIYALSLFIIFINTFFDQLSRDTVLFKTSNVHYIYYQTWIRSLIFPISALSLSPIKNVTIDISNIELSSNNNSSSNDDDVIEKLTIFSRRSLSELHEIKSNPNHSLNSLNNSNLSTSLSSNIIKPTNKYLITNNFYFLQCGVYKIPERMNRSRRISSSSHMITKKLPNTVTVQSLSPKVKIGITANDQSYQQLKQQISSDIPGFGAKNSINSTNDDNEDTKIPKYLYIGQYMASLSFTIYMILVMTAHKVVSMVNWLEIPCWILLSSTYIGLFIGFYKNINYPIVKYILKQPKVLAIMYLHIMHCYIDIVYGWSIIALPDCIIGVSFFIYFFGFDAMKYRINLAAQLSAIIFFGATLMDSILSIVNNNYDVSMFSICGYHFYRDAERFVIFLSMAILSAKALWTMIQDSNKLVWIRVRRRKRDQSNFR